MDCSFAFAFAFALFVCLISWSFDFVRAFDQRFDLDFQSTSLSCISRELQISFLTSSIRDPINSRHKTTHILQSNTFLNAFHSDVPCNIHFYILISFYYSYIYSTSPKNSFFLYFLRHFCRTFFFNRPTLTISRSTEGWITILICHRAKSVLRLLKILLLLLDLASFGQESAGINKKIEYSTLSYYVINTLPSDCQVDYCESSYHNIEHIAENTSSTKKSIIFIWSSQFLLLVNSSHQPFHNCCWSIVVNFSHLCQVKSGHLCQTKK